MTTAHEINCICEEIKKRMVSWGTEDGDWPIESQYHAEELGIPMGEYNFYEMIVAIRIRKLEFKLNEEEEIELMTIKLGV